MILRPERIAYYFISILFSLVVYHLVNLEDVRAESSRQTRSIMVILDASGSMNDRMNGSNRMKVAVSQLEKFVKKLPSDAQIGLVAYGNRIPGCDSARLYSPMKRGGGKDILAKLPLFFPAGSTPIARTLELVNDHILQGHPNTEIILVSDGIESCDGDPVAVVKKIQKQSPQVRIHVLGLDVPGHEERELQFLADAGSGNYYSVRDGSSLDQALSSIWTGRSDPTQIAPNLATQSPSDMPDFSGLFSEELPKPKKPFIRITQIEKSPMGKSEWEYRIWYDYDLLSQNTQQNCTAMLLFFSEESEDSREMPPGRIKRGESIEKSITVDHSLSKGKGYVRIAVGQDAKLGVAAELWEMESIPKPLAVSDVKHLRTAKNTESFDQIFR